MAGIIKVSNMPEILALADDGYLYAIKNGESKKIRKDNLMSGFLTTGYQSVADADTVFTNGWYSLPASLGATNSPVPGLSGTLLVVNGGDDNTYATQLWIRSDNSATQRMAFRSWDGSNWNDWVFAIDSDEFVKADAPTAAAGVDDSTYMTPLRTKEVVDSANASFMSGAVVSFATLTPPSGWLVCDGAEVSRTTYSTLFSLLGETWGAGDGSTTFNLPDLRGEFIRGLDLGRSVDSGRNLGEHQIGSPIGSIDTGDTLSYWPQVITIDSDTLLSSAPWDDIVGPIPTEVNSNFNTRSDLGVESNFETAGRTRPRNYALVYCIKT